MDTTVEEKKKDDLKLENFITAVYSEADKKSDSIIEAAVSSSDRVLNQADSKARMESEKYIIETRKRLETKTVKTIAKAELDGKKSILAKREELTEKIFDNVVIKLSEFRKTDEYLRHLINVVREQNPEIGVKICLMPSDMGFADKIKEASGTLCEFTEDKTIRIGGIIFYYESGGYVIDKTLDNAFEAQRASFHKKNYFGEALSE